MGETKNIGRLIEAVLGSKAFHDFVTVVRDAAEWAEDGHPVMMSKAFHRRNMTAERILQQTSCCGLEYSEANDITQSLLRAADMPLLDKFDWVDDTH